jgi:hypothetical protein
MRNWEEKGKSETPLTTMSEAGESRELCNREPFEISERQRSSKAGL